MRALLFERAIGPAGLPLLGLWGVVEAIAWLVLAGLGVGWLVRRRGRIPRPSQPALALVVAATAARLLVPSAPYNWYMSVQWLPSFPDVYSRPASYVPLPARILGFDMGLGFAGMYALNLVLGVAAVLVIWRAARHFALTELGAWLLALAVGLVPTFALLTSSEAPQITMLLLWGVAALAFAAVREGRGGWRAHAVLLAATLCAAPIRLESWLVFPSFVLLVGGRPADWRALAKDWRRYLPFALALVLGTAVSLGYRWEFVMGTTGGFGGLGTLIAILVFVPPATIGLMNLGWVSFLPLIVVVPAVYELVGCLRRPRDWSRFATNVVPAALFAAPVAAGTAMFIADLGTAAYFVLFLILPLIICVRGIERMVARFRQGSLLAQRWKRIAALALAAPALAFSFVLPYRFGYVFQDEFRFLSEHLPAGAGETVAVIWDPTADAGDYDCCLAHPHPLLVAARPDLHWLVLVADDLPRVRHGELEFDYYFPGTLTLLDAEGPECGYFEPLASDSDRERWRGDQARLRRLRELDEALRARFPMSEVARVRASVDANPPVARGTNGVNFGFPAEGVELTLYRRDDAPAATAGRARPPE